MGLLSCALCSFAVLADRWQVILGEFPGRCTQCARSAHTVRAQCNNLASRQFRHVLHSRKDFS